MTNSDEKLRPRVLVVDDDPDAVENMRDLLSQIGCEAQSIVDPFEAEALARSIRFDAAVLDYRMPGMNGIELCQRLKSIQPELPIALHSAFLPDDSQWPGTLYLAKPLELAALMSFVQSFTLSDELENP